VVGQLGKSIFRRYANLRTNLGCLLLSVFSCPPFSCCHAGQFSQRSERSSAVFEDILIASGKLSPEQQAKFDAYMNAHVTRIATQAREHMHRLEALLRQTP
jgi:hypothetical protein